MDKIERVDRVLDGKEVDYPPLSLWYHFGVQHGPGEQFAKITLEFFKFYDFDFLKVMNDYFYPPPQGLDAVKSREDLKKITPLNLDETPWQEQFKALDILGRELKGKAYFVDTVFDPWQSLRRSMAGENIADLMETEPEATLEALEIITDNLISYCERSLGLGSAGIFLSVAAARELIPHDKFLTFVKPFAKKLLEAISGMGRMNIAHIHGEDLYFEDVIDFPVDIFSWWDRSSKGPSLQQVKNSTSACVMGGINQKLVARTTPAFLKNHVREALEMGGKSRFFLANGCSIDPWTYPGSILAIVKTARE